MSKGWDNSMLKKLKALTGKGLSTSEIGKRLGMSKNAIVGKLNRLGWNAKAGGAAADAPAKKESKKAVAPEKKVTEKSAAKTVTKKAASKTVAPAAKKVVAKKETKKPATKKAAAPAAKKPAVKAVAPKEKAEKKDSKSAAKNLAMHQRIIQHSLEMANLKPNQCRWPIGDPDSEHFHFCGETVFVGKPYCYEHCKQAYQFTAPKKK